MSISRFFMVVILLFTTLHTNADEKEKVMYMIVENDVATFYYDELYYNKLVAGLIGAQIYDSPSYSDYIYHQYGSDISHDKSQSIINNIQSNILRVVFTPSFSNARPTSTRAWFHGMIGLKEIIGLEYLNTSYATTMRWMFSGCSSLTSLDLSNFNTDNVTDMSNMFSDCSSLFSLDVSSFNTSNVTNMYEMFSGCKSLPQLNLSSFNTSNVTDMVRMFYDCSGLTSLDLSNFNTGNVTNMSNMFSRCSGLTSLDVHNFNTSNVERIAGMFSGCRNLTKLDVSNFNTSNIVEMGSYPISSSDSHVIIGGGMFEDCSSLTSLDVSKFNTSNVTDMTGMFSGCSSLTSLNLSSFNTGNVKYINGMFSQCSSLEYIFLGEKITQMPSFSDSKKIKSIILYLKEPYAITSNCFADTVKENAKLYVPNSARTLYKKTDGWKDFKHIMSKDLEPESNKDTELGKDNIDENTDLNGSIINNIFFNVTDEAGEYNAAEGCIILIRATTDEQIKSIIGLDLFDEHLLNNFSGMIFMLDAGSGTIDIETETTGKMQLNVKIGATEPTTMQIGGKKKVSIPYNVAMPTLVYVYGSIPATQSTQRMHGANTTTENALKIYGTAWGKATGISDIYNTTDGEATIYNLNGQRVKTIGKGLYIVNGKKVIVK